MYHQTSDRRAQAGLFARPRPEHKQELGGEPEKEQEGKRADDCTARQVESYQRIAIGDRVAGDSPRQERYPTRKEREKQRDRGRGGGRTQDGGRGGQDEEAICYPASDTNIRHCLRGSDLSSDRFGNRVRGALLSLIPCAGRARGPARSNSWSCWMNAIEARVRRLCSRSPRFLDASSVPCAAAARVIIIITCTCE